MRYYFVDLKTSPNIIGGHVGINKFQLLKMNRKGAILIKEFIER